MGREEWVQPWRHGVWAPCSFSLLMRSGPACDCSWRYICILGWTAAGLTAFMTWLWPVLVKMSSSGYFITWCLMVPYLPGLSSTLEAIFPKACKSLPGTCIVILRFSRWVLSWIPHCVVFFCFVLFYQWHGYYHRVCQITWSKLLIPSYLSLLGLFLGIVSPSPVLWAIFF